MGGGLSSPQLPAVASSPARGVGVSPGGAPPAELVAVQQLQLELAAATVRSSSTLTRLRRTQQDLRAAVARGEQLQTSGAELLGDLEQATTTPLSSSTERHPLGAPLGSEAWSSRLQCRLGPSSHLMHHAVYHAVHHAVHRVVHPAMPRGRRRIASS